MVTLVVARKYVEILPSMVSSFIVDASIVLAIRSGKREAVQD